jgi:hypothetical protein
MLEPLEPRSLMSVSVIAKLAPATAPDHTMGPSRSWVQAVTQSQATLPSQNTSGLTITDNGDLNLQRPTTPATVGDAALDGKVDPFDLNLLAAHWQQDPGSLWVAGDFTGDGKVDPFDLNVLAANWQMVNTQLASTALAAATALPSNDSNVWYVPTLQVAAPASAIMGPPRP